MQSLARIDAVELYELPFVKLIKLGDDTLEVIVNEGVDYSVEMAAQYHAWVRSNMADPCFVMVNRINSYSYTYEVRQKLGSLEQIKAIAMVAYTRISQLSAESVLKGTRLTPLNSKIFNNREEALSWLESLRKT
jgi:hypothetical protein